MTLCDPIWHVISRSSVVISITNCYIRVYLYFFYCCSVVVEHIVTAMVGDRATLPCFSYEQHRREVDWRYGKTTATVSDPVWNRKYLVNGYKTRCVIETSTAGHYDLVIRQVGLNDSGFYDCIERGGFGKRHRIQLDIIPKTSEY